MTMFDFSSLKARANQNDKKTAGTTGTAGTTNAGAGFRVPASQNQNGDKRGQTTESKGKPAGNTGAALPIFGVPENLGAGKLANLSPVSPFAKTILGTKKTSVYAAVPSVPAVPAKKTANANEVAKTTGAGQEQGQDWRTLSRAYYAHHFTPCRHCIAAGLNPALERCPVGAMLWRAYLHSPDLSGQ